MNAFDNLLRSEFSSFFWNVEIEFQSAQKN